jgi:peptide/nickel transport system permease protein
MEDLEQAKTTAEKIESVEEEITSEEEKIYVAPYWKLMWWRFRKHKMALISVGILALFYLVGIFCEFVAPYDPGQYFVKYKLAPPSKVRIRDAEGQFHWPFVYKIERS